MAKKLYAYVDETWLDELFIVAIVIAGEQREELAAICEQAESVTGKERKWSGTAETLNMAYMRQVIFHMGSLARLHFVIFSHADDYTEATIEAIARAIDAQNLADDYKATIIYDGLPKHQEVEIGAALRKRRVRIRKVRGLNDEADARLRLADAVCGLLRDTLLGKPEAHELRQTAIRRGLLSEV